MESAAHVSVQRVGDQVVVALGGEVDLAESPRVRAALARGLDLARGAGVHLVVDLRTTSFFDSTGLRALVDLHESAKAASVPLVLRTNERIRFLLRVGGLREVFTDLEKLRVGITRRRERGRRTGARTRRSGRHRSATRRSPRTTARPRRLDGGADRGARPTSGGVPTPASSRRPPVGLISGVISQESSHPSLGSSESERAASLAPPGHPPDCCERQRSEGLRRTSSAFSADANSVQAR
jgi:anti-anti-sigma factor